MGRKGGFSGFWGRGRGLREVAWTARLREGAILVMAVGDGCGDLNSFLKNCEAKLSTFVKNWHLNSWK